MVNEDSGLWDCWLSHCYSLWDSLQLLPMATFVFLYLEFSKLDMSCHDEASSTHVLQGSALNTFCTNNYTISIGRIFHCIIVFYKVYLLAFELKRLRTLLLVMCLSIKKNNRPLFSWWYFHISLNNFYASPLHFPPVNMARSITILVSSYFSNPCFYNLYSFTLFFFLYVIWTEDNDKVHMISVVRDQDIVSNT